MSTEQTAATECAFADEGCTCGRPSLRLTAEPRPVPSPEDRMRDARTDREYADRIPAPRPLTTDRTNGRTRAVRELLASLADAGNTIDAAQAALHRAGHTDPAAEVADLIGQLAAQRDAARQTADFRQGVIDRHRQELGAAGDVLAVVRDAAERIDRALAVYDTTPGESEPEVDPDEDQAAIEKLIAIAHEDFASANGQSERVQAIRDLLDGWYAAWPDTAVTDPHEPIAWELAGLIAAAEARASAPSSVPPRRAQEAPPCRGCLACSGEPTETPEQPSSCPETVWDGPYSMRCGQGALGGVCATHGRFRAAEARP